jgi:hypothetical protein
MFVRDYIDGRLLNIHTSKSLISISPISPSDLITANGYVNLARSTAWSHVQLCSAKHLIAILSVAAFRRASHRAQQSRLIWEVRGSFAANSKSEESARWARFVSRERGLMCASCGLFQLRVICMSKYKGRRTSHKTECPIGG